MNSRILIPAVCSLFLSVNLPPLVAAPRRVVLRERAKPEADRVLEDWERLSPKQRKDLRKAWGLKTAKDDRVSTFAAVPKRLEPGSVRLSDAVERKGLSSIRLLRQQLTAANPDALSMSELHTGQGLLSALNMNGGSQGGIAGTQSEKAGHTLRGTSDGKLDPSKLNDLYFAAMKKYPGIINADNRQSRPSLDATGNSPPFLSFEGFDTPGAMVQGPRPLVTSMTAISSRRQGSRHTFTHTVPTSRAIGTESSPP